MQTERAPYRLGYTNSHRPSKSKLERNMSCKTHLLQMRRFAPCTGRNHFSVCLGLHQEGTFRIAWSGTSQHMQDNQKFTNLLVLFQAETDLVSLSIPTDYKYSFKQMHTHTIARKFNLLSALQKFQLRKQHKHFGLHSAQFQLCRACNLWYLLQQQSLQDKKCRSQGGLEMG